MTKREKYKNRIWEALKKLDEPVTVPIEKARRQEEFIEALLDCITDPPCQPRAKKTLGSQLWDHYVTLKKERWPKTNPRVSAKIRSQCKSLIERFGEKEAFELIGFYLKQNDAKFVQNYHSFEVLMWPTVAESLWDRYHSGIKVTGKDARNFESATDTANNIAAYRRQNGQNR